MSAIVQYVRAHWNGRQSLQRAWWLNCIMLSTIAGIIYLMPYPFGWRDLAARPYWLIGCAVIAILAYLSLVTWQLTGLWRTADFHMRHVGTILAGRAAQAAATVFTIVIALTFLAQTGRVGRLIPEALGVAPYTLTMQSHAHGRELEVRGGLHAGSSQEIERELERLGNVRRIRLNLNAGSIAEADRLGQIITTHNLDTYVSEACIGSCIIAFKMGRRRYMQRSAQLGIWFPEQLDIWFPSKLELKALGLVNTVYGRTLPAPSESTR